MVMVLRVAPSATPVTGLSSRALVAPAPLISARTEAGRKALSEKMV